MLENPILLRAKAFALHHCPYACLAAGKALSNTVLFQNERAYLAGRFGSGCDLPSVVYFTTVRSGSQYVGGLIDRIYRSVGGESLRLQKYYFHGRTQEEHLGMERVSWLEQNLKPQGFYYGPLSAPDGPFEGEGCKVVMGVRDPRDIMVSFFYSFAYAHTPADRKFVLGSREAREKGLEWFVRQPERIAKVKVDLGRLCEVREGKADVFCWRYEEMMGDFEGFLGSLVAHVAGGRCDDELMEVLLKEREESSKQGTREKENLLAHRRSGKSGVFREKLSAETVQFLNEEFGDILKHLDYQV
ncbi:MAG: sulfotransferase domain-containing protein [Verrucomicrobiota bacterium]